jgi:hypothetical protein
MMEAFPYLAFGSPLKPHYGLVLQVAHDPSNVSCPLGLGMGPFAMFHVLVVELYFPSVAWLIIRSLLGFSSS